MSHTDDSLLGRILHLSRSPKVALADPEELRCVQDVLDGTSPAAPVQEPKPVNPFADQETFLINGAARRQVFGSRRLPL